ncbi:MAG: hypothetical protein JW965_06170 [Bacteroidales bacterium]|nr:hypothetical protein [Bacteroidales bacterium]
MKRILIPVLFVLIFAGCNCQVDNRNKELIALSIEPFRFFTPGIIGAACSGFASCLGIQYRASRLKVSEDSAIVFLWAFGMAKGSRDVKLGA